MKVAALKHQTSFTVTKTVLILTCSLCLPIHVSAQDNVNVKKMVGFGCYYEGQPTKPVREVTQILKEKNYESLASLLDSKNPAKVYLAVISLQRLSATQQYTLSELDWNRILRAKGSRQLVSVCSGCTYFDKVPLGELLNKDTFPGSGLWLKKCIEEKKADLRSGNRDR
jgi:hypothetical protein